MKIEAKKIQEALQKYDDKTGLVSFYGSGITGERPGLKELRNLVKSFPTSKNKEYELNADHIIIFGDILVMVTDFKSKRHKALFTQLQELFGFEYFKAYKKLKEKQLMAYYEPVFAHRKPLSAAKAISHFKKIECEKEIALTLNELLKNEDPYTLIKSQTAEDVIHDFLKENEITIEEEKANASATNRIALYKAIKILNKLNNESTINKVCFDLLTHGDNPIKMAEAISQLQQKILSMGGNIETFELNDRFLKLLEETKEVNNPDFILAVIELLKIRGNDDAWVLCTEENKIALKKVSEPLTLVKALVFNGVKKMNTMSNREIIGHMIKLNIFNLEQDARLVVELKSEDNAHLNVNILTSSN